jgi:anti-anti-sigma factor
MNSEETPMNVSVSEASGRVPVTILRIQGDIDTNSYEALQQRAEQAIQAGARHLVLDLRDVGYVSSAGVRALNAIFQRLRALAAESDADLYQGVRAGTYKSPHLKLANAAEPVTKVLAMMGMDMFLDIHPSVNAAVESF